MTTKLLYHERIVQRQKFEHRYYKHREAANEAIKTFKLEPTAYFFEAMEYHERARWQQQMNLGKVKRQSCGDILQDSVPIYDTVERRYAGFSNVPEQLWYGPSAPKFKKTESFLISAGYPTTLIGPILTDREWFYLLGIHRITGSGASFMRDHGWRNAIVPFMAQSMKEGGLKAALRTLVKCYESGPIFTSLGNQIAPFNKPSSDRWRTGGIEYMHDVFPHVVNDMVTWLEAQKQPVGIQKAVDYALELNVKYGWRRFKFVFTAWVMDIAAYAPHLIDPDSDCYHGKNAIETSNLLFNRSSSKYRGQEFYDVSTRFLAVATNTKPYDVEDAFCDVIRWVENFVPKKNYEHLDLSVVWNSSSIAHPHGRQRHG